MSFTDCVSRILLLNSSKSAINWKNDNDVTTWRHCQIFWRSFVSYVKFSYWCKFHVNIITGSGSLATFFYKGLTRSLEIGNTSIWVLRNVRRLRHVRDSKFGTNISNEMLLNAGVTAFTVSELLRVNQLAV